MSGGERLLAREPQDVVAGCHHTDTVALTPTLYRFTVKDYHRRGEPPILRRVTGAMRYCPGDPLMPVR